MATPDEYFFDPIADVFTPVKDLLKTATGKDSYFLEPSRNHAIERWDWTPRDGTAAQGPDNPGPHPQRSLDTVDFRCDIACRGRTYTAAWLMLQQLVSACRRVKCAAFRIEGYATTESSDQAATLKTVVIATVVFKMPLLEQPLDKGTTTATIEHAEFDTSPPYGDDDGTLIAPLG